MQPDLFDLMVRYRKVFGIGMADVHRRRKMLVSHGLAQHGKRGRGPNYVTSTAREVAGFLISLLATDSKERAGEAGEAMFNLPAEGGECYLTETKTFGETLTALLESEHLAKIVLQVNGSRTVARAEILVDEGAPGRWPRVLGFGDPDCGFDVRARLRGDVLRMIGDDLAGRPIISDSD